MSEPPREPDEHGPADDAVLPEQTRDDTDAGWPEQRGDDDEERLLRERPPHWE